jgi:hypothetical protein
MRCSVQIYHITAVAFFINAGLRDIWKDIDLSDGMLLLMANAGDL